MSTPGDVLWANGRAWHRDDECGCAGTRHWVASAAPGHAGGRETLQALHRYADVRWLVKDGTPVPDAPGACTELCCCSGGDEYPPSAGPHMPTDAGDPLDSTRHDRPAGHSCCARWDSRCSAAAELYAEIARLTTLAAAWQDQCATLREDLDTATHDCSSQARSLARYRQSCAELAVVNSRNASRWQACAADLTRLRGQADAGDARPPAQPVLSAREALHAARARQQQYADWWVPDA